MTLLKTVVVLLALAQMSACASLKCDEPQPYMQARTNNPITVPPDLDSPINETTSAIPPGATGGEQLPSGRCIETPPSYVGGTPTELTFPDDTKLEDEPSDETTSED